MQTDTSRSVKSAVVAISKGKGGESYEAYSQWIHKLDSNVKVIDLYHLPKDSVLPNLKRCDGIIFSGGPDINPLYYTSSYDTSKCGFIDSFRDSLEFLALDYAVKNKMPILGVCRGLQLINVYQKGSLFIDLPSQYPSNTKHRCQQKDNCYHPIYNSQNNFLFQISGTTKGFVNSNHHQGIEILGDELEALAYSPDHLTEAIGWKDHELHPFMIAVQWHPERLSNRNPYSTALGREFLKSLDY